MVGRDCSLDRQDCFGLCFEIQFGVNEGTERWSGGEDEVDVDILGGERSRDGVGLLIGELV